MNHNLTAEVEGLEKFSLENLVYCQESDMGRIAREEKKEIEFYKVATNSKLT